MLARYPSTAWTVLAVICAACGNGNDHNDASNETGGVAVVQTTSAGGALGAGGASHTSSPTGGTSGTKTTLRTGGTLGTGGTSDAATTSRTGGTSAVGGASQSGGTKTSSGGSKTTVGGTSSATGGTKATGGTRNTAGTSGNLGNVVNVVVDEGPSALGYMNGLFVDVTLCVPGTATCQTIDHVLVDTGSYGLRVLESALTVTLPAITNSAGATLGECAQFVSGTAWGPVVRADVKIGDETAAAIPVHTIGESKYPMPNTSACTGVPLNDISSLRSNGVLGVGLYQQDCGAACTRTTGNPGVYVACTSAQAGGCKATAVSLDLQVSNPIISFPVDNNGVIIQLPDVPDQGAASVAGKMIFGIGTQPNNDLGSATVFKPVNDYGYIGTSFPAGGAQYSAILDSGSNAIYFLDAATSGLAACPATYSGFYCPASTTSLSATIYGSGAASTAIDFKVTSVTKLNARNTAFDTVAGEMPGSGGSDPAALDFIWGLSFFYGRSIYTAIEQQTTPAGTGPYVAF